MLSKRSICVLILAALPVASCNCQDTVQDAPPQFKASDSSLVFGLVCLDSDNPRDVEVRNIGASSGNLSWSVVAAPGASSEFDPAMFTVSPAANATVPVSAGGTQVITVTYHPGDDRANDQPQLGKIHKAMLRLSTDDPEHRTIDILLDGTVSDREPTPIFSVQCAGDLPACSGQDEACCSDLDVSEGTPGALGRTRLIQAGVGNVSAGMAQDVKLEISNLGCGQLDIPTTWQFDNQGDCPAEAVAIPEMGGGLSIPGSPTVDGIQSREITVRFTAPQDSCTLFGDAVLTTNDPVINAGGAAAQWSKLRVIGAATAPAIAVTPVGGLAFGQVDQGTCVEKSLIVYNTSALPIRLDLPEIIAGIAGKPSDFVYKGAKYDPLPCEGDLVDWDFDSDVLQPLEALDGCGADEVEVTIAYCPGTNDLNTDNDEVLFKFEGGQLRVSIRGGSDPILELRGGIDDAWFYGPHHFGCEACGFGNCPDAYCQDDNDCPGESCLIPEGATVGACASEPTCLNRCGFADRKVLMCNVGKGDLVVSQVKVTKDYFHVIAGDCLGTVIQPDDCCPITLSVDGQVQGGTDEGQDTMTIVSNDGTFPGTVPIRYVFDGADVYEAPIARLVVRDATCADGNVADLDGQKTIYLDASSSTHDVNYTWKVTRISPEAMSEVPVDVPIDPLAPDARFFAFGADCDGPQNPPASVLAFTPDKGQPFPFYDYEISVTVDDGTCAALTPLGQSETRAIVKAKSKTR